MSSRINSICKELADLLSATEWSQKIKVRKTYLPKFDLESDTGIIVSVVPVSSEDINAARKMRQQDINIDVGVQKKLDRAPDDDELLEMMLLVQEISDFMTDGPHTSLPQLVRVSNDPIYDYDYLNNYNQFTSVLRFTFRTMRSTRV